ncbi:MAG: PEP-CTERM sorting domain-containing protein [Vicinamibacterales bacterium]
MVRRRFSMLALATALLLGGARMATASPIGIMLAFDGGVDLGLTGAPQHEGAEQHSTGIHSHADMDRGPFGVRPYPNTTAWNGSGDQSDGEAWTNAEWSGGGNGPLDFTDGGFGPGSGDDSNDGRGGLQLAEAITNGPGVDSLASDYFRIVGDLRPPPVFSTAPETPPVPEPATLAMLLGGLASLALLRGRRVPAKVKVASRA